MSIHELFVYAM